MEIASRIIQAIEMKAVKCFVIVVQDFEVMPMLRYVDARHQQECLVGSRSDAKTKRSKFRN